MSSRSSSLLQSRRSLVSPRSSSLLQCRPPPAAPRGQKSCRAPARLPRSASDPRTRSVLFSFSPREKTLKKSESPLDFPLTRCKLLFGIGLPLIGNRFPSSFQSYFSKRRCKPTKLIIALLLKNVKYSSTGRLYLRVLLDVSLSFLERVLGRTYIFAYGDASGFFYFPDISSNTV